MPSFRLSPERRGWRRLRQLVGKRTPGRTWIPGFAGKTGGGGVYANCRATDTEEGTWIPGFAGMTGGMAASTPTCGQTDTGEGTWIPGFAGKTGVAASTPTCGQTDTGEGTWIPAFAGKTGVMMYSVPCGNWRAYGHLGATWIPAKAGKTEGKLRNGSCLRGGPPTLPGVLPCALIWEPRVAGPAIRIHGPHGALFLRRRPFPQSEARWAGPRSLVRKAPKSPDAR